MEESTRKRAFDEHGRYLPRYRMFIVSEGDAEAERRSGIGVTAEHVIADWQDLFRGWHDQNATERGEGLHEGVTDAELADGFLDCVVWDITAGAKVVAVMRPDPTGKRELVVTRFDGAPRPAAAAVQTVFTASGLSVEEACRRLTSSPRPTIAVDRDGKGVAS